MIGQTISHYRILEKLGEGGMGVVYKAEDIKLHRPVALKVLPRQALITEEDKTRFAREAQAAASLSHPNIAIIHEFDEVDDPVTGGKLAFIAMEYVDGETVKQKITERPLPLDEALKIAIAVAEGLAEAHGKGIVHRDIKSENVMISRSGVVKIMDFGLAEIAGRTRVTKEGITVGTAAYMSPEQALGEKLDQRTDIWSLGVVMYEMITSRLPFAGDYEQAIVYRILNEEPEPITSLRSNVPMELERIVKKAMQKDRTKRYQHVDEVLTDLRSLRTEKATGLVKQPLGRRTAREQKRAYLYSVVAGIAVLLIVGGVYLWRSGSEKKTEVMPRRNKTEAAIETKWKNSIAVLPFIDLSPQKDQEYFCDGMTEQIITSLTNIPDLKVIARTSVMRFKKTEKSVIEIAKDLGVATVLEGSIRKSGNRLRITAQLIKADEGSHLWAKDYDRELKDVFAVQGDVAKAITEALKIKLTGEQTAAVLKRYTENTEAYQAYLKGRYYWNKRTEEGFKKAIGYFQQAIEIDPAFALAYAGLADTYNLLAPYGLDPARESFPKAKAAAMKALEIDQTLAEAHTSLAWVRHAYDWDWLSAEKEFRRAIELNPNYGTAHHWFAWYSALMGLFEQAIVEIKRARDSDPLSLIINADAGVMYYYARQFDQAIEQGKRAVELDSSFAVAHLHLGAAYSEKSMYPAAIAELQKAVRLSGGSSRMVSALGHVYAISGNTNEAHNLLNDLKQLSKRKYVNPYFIALIYTGLGEKDQAFEWLEKAYQERDFWLSALKVEPMLDILRRDPRFSALLKKVGLEK